MKLTDLIQGIPCYGTVQGISKDKSNVTFELSFMVNGQYRSKDYEKIISDFAF